MDGGALTQNTDYPIKAFMTERAGKDYIRIMYQVGGGSFERGGVIESSQAIAIKSFGCLKYVSIFS